MKSTYEMLFDKYGPTLTLEQIGQCLHKEPSTLSNLISAGKLPFATWKEGKARVAHAADVAKHIDTQRKSANDEYSQEQAKRAS